jgi:hypothetical protein
VRVELGEFLGRHPELLVLAVPDHAALEPAGVGVVHREARDDPAWVSLLVFQSPAIFVA